MEVEAAVAGGTKSSILSRLQYDVLCERGTLLVRRSRMDRIAMTVLRLYEKFKVL